jgi:ribonuclease HI
MSEKYYVVWKGHNPGIYSSWIDCQKQIKEYKHAIYKSFKTKELAERAFKMDYSEFIGKDVNQLGFISDVWDKNIEKPILKSICVDAACSGNPGKMEYKGVDTVTKKEIFHQGPFDEATNNIGEFLAIVHALALLKNQNSDIPVYSDSETAYAWVKHKNARTKLDRNNKNEKVFQLIKRAEEWLKNNKHHNVVLKWKTDIWGEIPADFGRK